MTDYETPRDPDTELGGYDNPNPPYTDDAWAMVAGAFPGKQPEHVPGQLTLDDARCTCDDFDVCYGCRK